MLNTFVSAETHRKNAVFTAILFKKFSVPFGEQLLCFDVFHEVRGLTVKHFANLVECVYRKMLYRVIADCGDGGRTDAGSLCQIFLGHFADGKHYFYFEFYHNRTPLGV